MFPTESLCLERLAERRLAIGNWQLKAKNKDRKAVNMAGKAMEKRMIGSSDMNVSVIALGCFSFGGDHAQGSQMG